MVIEKGQILDLEGLRTFFHVSRSLISKKQKRAELLKELHQYCDFIEKRGPYNKIFYEITKVYIEEGPEEKGKYEKNLKIYKKKALEIIKSDPLQTYTSISSHFYDDKEIQTMEHKRSTQVKYVGDGVKEMFGKNKREGGPEGVIEDRIWCKREKDINGVISYKPFNDEEREYFGSLISTQHKEVDESLTELYARWKNKEISREEYCLQVGEQNDIRFESIFHKFEAKFGSYPINVPKYMVGENPFIPKEGKFEF